MLEATEHRRTTGGTTVRGRAAALLAIPLACALTVTACAGEQGGGDDLQLVADPVAVAPAAAPPVATPPGGTVLAAGAATAMAVHPGSRTLGVAVDGPPAMLLYPLDELSAPPRSVPLPGRADSLDATGEGFLAALPGAGALARISAGDGALSTVPVAGQPSGTAATGDRTLVSVRDRKAVDVLDGDRVSKSVTGQLYSADDVFTPGGRTVVLDRLRTALFDVDLDAGTVNEGLRAGDGAANAVVDRHARVLVTDARAGALLAFSADPLLLRQRYPVPGGPYGIAYDERRDLAWVTLTERNEVVGFDVGGGEPVERFRFPTVRQPDTVTVDAGSGQVMVGSATGEGIQVIAP
ncbi:hypothetical protein CFN78_11385 [Amycolatopsis antarctica]|uniref:Lipoprotein n=1 Tax=Amycolatopsis antarctica TaxID=1854586 RepID=A0A263D468_9PSEU|nr:hypothetical protein [Amycolatopsis antarctica]OZM72868.1 hypothetical protein CFN78_11385 [Amycolatopsis antarctica]